jgi:hypothetical protein
MDSIINGGKFEGGAFNRDSEVGSDVQEKNEGIIVVNWIIGENKGFDE